MALDREDIAKVITLHLKQHKRAAAVYSGSRRNGYYMAGVPGGLFPDKTSLLSQLNERPEFITVFRMSAVEGRQEVLMANSFPAETYL